MILAHGKHGVDLYLTARACLRDRIEEEWYYGKTAKEAELVLLTFSEDKAWRFLDSRSGHEYEYVEMVEPRA